MDGKEFRVVFSSAEWFGTEFRECASTVFWFHGTEFRDVFSSAEGFGTELWDFASFLFHGTEFRVIFSSPEGFGTEFRDFLFRETTGIPSDNHLFRLFRLPRNYFFVGNSQPYRRYERIPMRREFPTLTGLL